MQHPQKGVWGAKDCRCGSFLTFLIHCFSYFPPYKLFAPNTSFSPSLFSGCIVLTSPVCDGLAPIYSWSFLICEEGPVMREVPESTMASQPWEQNATRPWILILQVKKKKASLNKSWLSHCDWSNTSLPAEVQPAVKTSYQAFPILKVKNVFKGKVKKASSIRKTSHLWAHFSLSGLLQPQPAACWQTCPHPRWGVYPRGFYEAQTKGTLTALTKVKRKN